LIDQGVLIATDRVLVELRKKEDKVVEWAIEHEDLFVPIDDEIQIAVSEILKNHRKLIDQRPGRSGADPFVIALALVKNCAVITGEKPTFSEKRPNIPDVCDALGIRWIDILGLFREQEWKF